MNTSHFEAEANGRGTAYRLRDAVFVLATMIAASTTLNMVLMPLSQVADPVRSTFVITDVQFSLLMGLFAAIPSILMSVAGGWLTDRLSRRRLLLGAMTAWTVGGIWTALAPSYDQMALSRILVAGAAGIKFPLAITWINDAFPAERRGRAVGIFFVVLGIGPAIGAALGGVVLQASEAGRLAQLPVFAKLEPWRSALLLLAMTNLVVMPFVALLKDSRIRATAREVSNNGATTMPIPLAMIIAVVVAVSLLGLGDNANLSWLPTVLRRQHGFNAQQVGFAFGLITTCGGVFGSLAGGFIGDWIYRLQGTKGRLRACGLAAFVSACLLVSYASPNAQVLIGSLVINAVFSVMAMTLGYVAFQALLPEDHRGLGIGLGGAVSNLAGSSGPTLVAFVAARLAGSEALGTGVAAVTVTSFIAAALLYLVVSARVGHWQSAGKEPELRGAIAPS